MLDPDFILHMTEGCEHIAEQLHQEIINRIVERIMIRIGRGEAYLLTAQDKWQIEVLQDAGVLLRDIKMEIARKTKLQSGEIAAAFKEAGVKTVAYDNAVYKSAGIDVLSFDQSPFLIRLMERGYKKTFGEWENYTGTLANAAQRLFIAECDKAYNLVSSGAVSYTQAVKEAVQTISKDGVVVTYPSGHRDTIETATLRAVRTGVAQACAEIVDARLDDFGWDIVLTSAHLGARVGDGGQNFTNHSWWQGKFYSRSGQGKRFPPFSVCGLGDVQGIEGANCRHSYGAGDGEHNPFTEYNSAENLKAYELSQKQREIERSIRKTKREVMALNSAGNAATDATAKKALQDAYEKKSAVLSRQNAKYRQFCKDNDLKTLDERLSIANWDRAQAAKASAAARKYTGA